MNILQRTLARAGEALQRIASTNKFVDFPTINGGMDIFRNFVQWDNAWSETKRLGTYRRSLYVFACVHKIAQKVANIDWELYKIVNKLGDKKQLFVHEALDLLYKPNPFQTKEEFFMRFMINKKLAGQAFILKVRDDSGKVVEMWNLRPDFMRIIFDKQLIIKAYAFTNGNGQTIFDPNDIIHDSSPDPLLDFGGMSPLQPAQSRVDTEEFATKYQSNFFVNNARPDFVLMSDKKIGAEQKEEMKEAWDKRHKSADQKNVGKGAFLEGGLTYQQVSISQREMDYIESLKMTRDDILVAFGVPKPIVAITEDVNYSNAETAMTVFLSETIVPEIKSLTNKLNEHFVYQEFGEIYYLDFEDPVPDNETEKADIQAKRILAGTLLINEAREEWGDDPIAGGNSLYMPIGMIAVGGKANPTKSVRKDVRKNVFRGRGKAYKFLEIKEKVLQTMVDAVLIEAKKKDLPTKDQNRPLKMALIKEEIKAQYCDMVLKSIDDRGEVFEKAVTKFMKDEQLPRARKALKLNDKDFSVKIVDDIEGALKKWAKGEYKLAAEFSIPFITEFVKAAGIQAMQTIAPAESFDATTEKVQSFIKQRAKDFGKSTTDTTLDKLARTLSEGIASSEGTGELVARIDGVYEDFPLYRSQMIGRTESTAANNLGFVESYQQSGVANAKEWIATHDSRTRDSHLEQDGEIVGLDANFSNGLQYPGDGNGDPAETINCRCVLGPAFQE